MASAEGRQREGLCNVSPSIDIERPQSFCTVAATACLHFQPSWWSEEDPERGDASSTVSIDVSGTSLPYDVEGVDSSSRFVTHRRVFVPHVLFVLTKSYDTFHTM